MIVIKKKTIIKQNLNYIVLINDFNHVVELFLFFLSLRCYNYNLILLFSYIICIYYLFTFINSLIYLKLEFYK